MSPSARRGLASGVIVCLGFALALPVLYWSWPASNRPAGEPGTARIEVPARTGSSVAPRPIEEPASATGDERESKASRSTPALPTGTFNWQSIAVEGPGSASLAPVEWAHEARPPAFPAPASSAPPAPSGPVTVRTSPNTLSPASFGFAIRPPAAAGIPAGSVPRPREVRRDVPNGVLAAPTRANRPAQLLTGGTGEPAVWAMNSSGSPTVNVGSLLGAERFYSAGYTGFNARVANIEGGTPWRSHETLNWMPAANIFWSGAGLNEGTSPSSVQAHATATSMNMVGKAPAGSTDPVLQRGIAYGINPNNFYGGNIASSFGSGGSFFWSSWTDFKDVYYRAIVQGVGPNNTVDAANRVDVVNSSWGAYPITYYNLEPDSQIIDSILFEGNQTRGSSVVFSAGNQGPGTNTVGAPGTGFNSIVVGALGESATDPAGTATFNVATTFSSRGPTIYRQPSSATDDTGTSLGAVRAAVSIAAPGYNMRLADTGSAGAYSTWWGTSFAAPTVAGGIALLADYAWTSLTPTNAASAVDGRVIKAVLINSADKTSGWNNGQSWNGTLWATGQGLDFTTGGGRMNLDQAFNQFVNGGGNTITQLINPVGTGPHNVLQTGWTRATLDRPNPSAGAALDFVLDGTLAKNTELNTTLTWFVNAGSVANTSNPTVLGFHNLDLEVWLADSAGNAVSLVGVSTSDHNNVEHLSFLVPETGRYLIRVLRPSDAGGGTYYSFAGDSTSDVIGLAWMARPGLQALSGTTNVSSGTQSQANVLVAPDVGQTATLAVSGSGTRLNVLNRLYVGGTDRGAGGTGTVTISGDAVVDVSNTAQVFTGGTLSVAGSTLSGGVLALNAGSSFTLSGTPILQFSRIDAAAPIVVSSGAIATVRSFTAFNGSNSGRLNLLSAASSFDVNGDGVLRLHPVITGTNGLVKNGTGTLYIATTNGGQNTYSGTTVVNAGTLRLAVANSLPDGSTVRLNGGTFSTGLTTGFSDTVGPLELAATSGLALGTGSHALTFSGITGTPTGVLFITGWAGSPNTAGTDGDIRFVDLGGNPNSAYASFLATVQFQGYGLGQATFINVMGNTELVPVPEPASVFGVAGIALLIGFGWRRSRRKCPEPT